MIQRPQQLNLSNWRQSPSSQWSFHHVREVIPTEIILTTPGAAVDWPRVDHPLDRIKFEGADSAAWSLDQLHKATNSDALLVAHKGRLVHEWYAHDDIGQNPHIVFSVSKSITATLAGVFVEQGLLDPDKPVLDYLPELGKSAYADCSVQQVLDMTVSLDFDELYTATDGKFVEYRVSTGWHPGAMDQIDLGLHDFLISLGRGNNPHGESFEYKSPNSDLLGWLLETVGGEPLAKLFSTHLWQPMAAEADACITVDRKGAPRSAGGFCALPRDLLRFGELMRNQGRVGDRQVIPQRWIDDCREGGNPEVWQRSTGVEKFPQGSYRNKWYQAGNEQRVFCAIGIHSQWIYVDPQAEVVIVKLSCQSEPLNAQLGLATLRAFEAICSSF